MKIKENQYNKIIELYNSNKTLKEIGNIYFVDKATILNILKLNNVKIRKYTTNYDLELIKKLLIEKIPYRKIEKDYGISRGYLSKINKSLQ